MPSPQIIAFAKKAGKSEAEAEKAWKDAKAVVKKEYPDVSEEDDRFFKLVTGIMKKMLGLKESFTDFADNQLTDLDLVFEKHDDKKKKDEEVDDEEDESDDEMSDKEKDDEKDEEVDEETGDKKKKKEKK